MGMADVREADPPSGMAIGSAAQLSPQICTGEEIAALINHQVISVTRSRVPRDATYRLSLFGLSTSKMS